MPRVLLTLLIFIIIVIIMIVISTQIYRKYENINKKIYPSKEQIWRGNEKRALILFQPSYHNTVETMVDYVGNYLSSNLKYTVIKNYITCTEVYELDKMDLLVFATPIYMEKCSPNLVEYLQNNSFQKKKVILLATGIHPEVMRELEELSKLLYSDNEIYMIKIARDEIDKIGKFIEQKIK
ncbi:MAG: flavodoxin family protein [Lachnospiraceae bacterium]